MFNIVIETSSKYSNKINLCSGSKHVHCKYIILDNNKSCGLYSFLQFDAALMLIKYMQLKDK